ncbi:alpha-mannosyltransferase [Methyloceanibacter methanicus]|uniref:Alpha-mannosyltransferase n=1 Tax=Methyloceanibacter methanicus TaxID=1774968 RepID=A0A1E3VZ65_9HYPH|nr:glycosyltransferase family 1 protein [Methyloceanibacter methanicus]ODR98800.1 alpha-mannosyltransferase [Methyloceanibacter methanicus]
MHILVVTDAWFPQVNGVVRTYERLAQEIPKFGAEISFLVPSQFRTLPCPTYPEIRLALATPGMVDRYIEGVGADFVHIATEGPLGLLARSYCRKHKRPFTTSYHTRFPEYISARLPIPESWGYSFQRRFHNSGAGMFVAAPSVEEDLEAKGFQRMMRWTRGVDVDLFRPRNVRLYGQGPVFIYVGRVAVEKNIEAFLKLDLPGRKVVVGGGPQLAELKRAYPDVLFTGPKEGLDLAEAYASGDVFVFPSLTDTFGLVLLEALACGVPVAAYPVHGPKDVVDDPEAGVLDPDLRTAALKALDLSRDAARSHALNFSWENSAQQFLDNVLAAHNLGLPERRRLLPRLRPKMLMRKKTAA